MLVTRPERVRKIDRAARGLERSGIGWALRQLGSWHGTLVFNYHRIGTPDARGFERELWSADADAFERQVRLLAERFDVIAPSAVPELHGRRGRNVAITFDDGYRDNFELALPILARYGVPAAFFIVPDYIDRPRVAWWDEIAWIVKHCEAPPLTLPEHGIAELPLDDPAARQRAATLLTDAYKLMPAERAAAFLDDLADAAGCGRCPADLAADDWMTWDHVRALAEAGMEVGGHSLTHPVLARLERRQQEREIRGCAARLADELGQPMTLFSYPVGLAGTWNEDTTELVSAAGVSAAFSFEGGYLARDTQLDPLAIPRAGIAPDVSLDRFAALASLPQLFARW